jgi:basic amino acid/polyamine antiporter, APA family
MATVPAVKREAEAPKLLRRLSLRDLVLLVIGGSIGSGIFLTPQSVAGVLGTPIPFLLVWLTGLVVTLAGCFAFAELGSMFPETGGQYVYLRHAYGDFVGFLFGWMIFTVNMTGGVAALAVGFAQYVGVVIPPLAADHVVLASRVFTLTVGQMIAVAAVAFITVINVFGVKAGAVVQNMAAWTKFTAVALFIGVGFLFGHGSAAHFTKALAGSHATAVGFGIALIAVFWTFDGWVFAGYVSGEVHRPERNVPRGMVIGMSIVGTIYITMNVLYLYAMPVHEIATSNVVAQRAAVLLFSPRFGGAIAALVAISCFGGAAAALLAGARVYYAMAEDGLFFHKMAEVHPRWHTPAFSLIAQGVWTSVLCLSGSYEQLFTYTIFMTIVFYAATVAAVFLFRRRMPDAERPYRCTGYPFMPALYILVTGAWTLNALIARPKESLSGTAIVLLGVPAYLYWKRKRGPALVNK